MRRRESVILTWPIIVTPMMVPVIVIEVVITPMIVYVVVPVIILPIPLVERTKVITINVDRSTTGTGVPRGTTSPVNRSSPWDCGHCGSSCGT
jgi:hypothetical protein